MTTDAFWAATAGPVSALLHTVARGVRGHRPPHEADADGSTEADLVQDLATELWMARARRPDVGPGYLARCLRNMASNAGRRSMRTNQHKRAAAELAYLGGWWAPDQALVDGEARAEARVTLSRLPARAITDAGAYL